MNEIIANVDPLVIDETESAAVDFPAAPEKQFFTIQFAEVEDVASAVDFRSRRRALFGNLVLPHPEPLMEDLRADRF